MCTDRTLGIVLSHLFMQQNSPFTHPQNTQFTKGYPLLDKRDDVKVYGERDWNFKIDSTGNFGVETIKIIIKFKSGWVYIFCCCCKPILLIESLVN